MPIEHRHGDLLAANMDVLAHGCNCFCTMGGGIARAIRAKYPEVYVADCSTRSGDRSKLGTYSYCLAYDGTTVFNLYTQFTYGSGLQVDYEAVMASMYKMKDWLDAADPECAKQVGFPHIGCGLAGGDWKVVEEIIETVFNDRTVYVYVL